MKLSGIVFAYAALAALVAGDLWPPGPIRWRIRWRRPLVAAAVATLFAIAFYFLWLSKGWTAIDARYGTAWGRLPAAFIEGWAATVASMVSLGDLAARVLQRPGRQILQTLDSIYLIGSLPALLLLGWSGWRLRRTHPHYLRFAGAAAVIYVAAMAVIYGEGGELRMEDRFYRPLAMVLLIGVVHAVATSRPCLRLPLGALAAATMLYGTGSYVVRLQHNLEAPLGGRASTTAT